MVVERRAGRWARAVRGARSAEPESDAPEPESDAPGRAEPESGAPESDAPDRVDDPRGPSTDAPRRRTPPVPVASAVTASDDGPGAGPGPVRGRSLPAIPTVRSRWGRFLPLPPRRSLQGVRRSGEDVERTAQQSGADERRVDEGSAGAVTVPPLRPDTLRPTGSRRPGPRSAGTAVAARELPRGGVSDGRERTAPAPRAPWVRRRTGATPVPAAVRQALQRQVAAVSAVVIVLGVVCAAVAVPAAWVLHTVVDDQRFTTALAGLADEDAVRDTVRARTEAFVTDTLPVPRGAGPDASRAVDRAADRVFSGERWDGLWRGMVGSAHDEALASLRGDPVTRTTTDRDGGLGIRIGPAVAALRQGLIADDVASAGMVPPTDETVVLVDRQALGVGQAVWRPLVVLGSLLPWAAVVALALGIGLARHRWRALAVAAFGFVVAVTVAGAVCNAVRDRLVATAPSREVADAVRVVVGTASVQLGQVVLVAALAGAGVGVVALVVLGVRARVARRTAP